MQGKELLKHFKDLPEQEQNKILVDAYRQIAALHDSDKSFDSFRWNDCALENGHLSINVNFDDYFNDESFQRNLLDYARVIYCLTTGNKSAESMSWDAGRKIHSDVLREIVLTICGRNYSIEPLIAKLRKPYIDDDTFFSYYSTVAEKEGRELYERQKRIDNQNRAEEAAHLKNIDSTTQRKSWGEKIAIFIVLVLCFGGYKAYKYNQDMQNRQAVQQIRQNNERYRQIQQSMMQQSFKERQYRFAAKKAAQQSQQFNEQLRQTLQSIKNATVDWQKKKAAQQSQQFNEQLSQRLQSLINDTVNWPFIAPTDTDSTKIENE